MGGKTEFITLIGGAMKRRHMSQAELAEACGVVGSTVSYWMNPKGGFPEDDRVRKISAALGVPYNEIKKAMGEAVVITVPMPEDASDGARRLMATFAQLPRQYQEALINTAEGFAQTLRRTILTPAGDREGAPDRAPESDERGECQTVAQTRRLW